MKQIIALIAILAVAFGAWKFWPQIKKMAGGAADGNGGGGNQVSRDDGPSGKTDSQPKKTAETKETKTLRPVETLDPSPTTFTPEFSLELDVSARGEISIAGHSNFPAGVEVRLTVILDEGKVFPMKPQIVDAEGEFKCPASEFRSFKPGLWIIQFGVHAIDQSEEGQRALGSQLELIKSKYLKKDPEEGVVLVAFAKLDVRKIKIRRGSRSIKLKFSERMPTFR